MAKIGRNDKCPCGSGKKYKKCCIDNHMENSDLKIALERMEAKRLQLEKQQGLGRPIISTLHNGYRFISIGSELHYSKSWLTFHDFLFYYIKKVFGQKWGEIELAKPESDRHPIIKWMRLAHEHMMAYEVADKEIKSAPMNGAAFALISLSYNLYLLGHNAELRDRLIERLRKNDGFEAALYETFVAAIFINAGYKIELENEDDPAGHHEEFVATDPTSDKKFSVEAKHRKSGKDHTFIRNQLYAALKKKLRYERVVFIDLNIPKFTMDNIEDVIKEMDAAEGSMTIDGVPAPAAYVFVTNHSFAYDLSGTSYERAGFAHGFKIADFKIRTMHTTIREAVDMREKHKEIDRVATSMKKHATIPSTFDGEIPLFAFNEAACSHRLLIGNSYLVPTKDGAEEIG
ncbi:MAG: SEC-C metal-binding domain-containing protein, partial [Candidatus Omnitrophota bacterium]